MGSRKRADDKLSQLAGKTWNRLPARDHLWNRLTGEDGLAPWTNEEAAAQVSKKLSLTIYPQLVSNWYKEQRANRKARENFEIVQKVTLEFFADTAAQGAPVDIAQMVDAQLVFMIGRIHTEEGAEEAINALKAFTAHKKVIIEEGKLKQRITEHEESAGKLKEIISKLHAELKKHGLNQLQIDELNRATVAAIDEKFLGISRAK